MQRYPTQITSNELNKTTTHDKYKGRNRVYTAEGNGVIISHIGYSKLRTPHSILHLNEILHTPHASKKFMSIHKLTLDNNVLIEFHPWFFLIKDQVTRMILFRGSCYGGLYPLVHVSTGSSKKSFITIKSSSSLWYRHLEHPSSFVVQQVLRKKIKVYTPMN
jgi:hypothetical protein